MQCRRGLAMRKLYVRPSVCLTNAWTMIKRNKDLSRFLYLTKEPSFLRRRMVGEGRPLLPDISAPVGAKSPILSRYSLVAP